MLEAEFETDRRRKDAQASEDARRQARAVEEALSRVQRIEGNAKRERRNRIESQKREAEKRARLIKQVCATRCAMCHLIPCPVSFRREGALEGTYVPTYDASLRM
jgi:hypothetical protein